MSKPDHWMKLGISDWDAATIPLTNEEEGAYFRLVRFYWKNGAPPDNDVLLARIVREPVARWRKLRPVLSPFFVIVDGKWTHKRVERELADARERYERRSKAGSSNVAKRKDRATNASTNGSAETYQSKTQEQIHSPTFGGEEDAPGGEVVPLAPRSIGKGRG